MRESIWIAIQWCTISSSQIICPDSKFSDSLQMHASMPMDNSLLANKVYNGKFEPNKRATRWYNPPPIKILPPSGLLFWEVGIVSVFCQSLDETLNSRKAKLRLQAASSKVYLKKTLQDPGKRCVQRAELFQIHETNQPMKMSISSALKKPIEACTWPLQIGARVKPPAMPSRPRKHLPSTTQSSMKCKKATEP